MNRNLYKKLIAVIVCLFISIQLFAQSVQVTGVVKNPQGEGLPGVSVKIKGTPAGTVTDVQGSFSLRVPAEGTVLVISYVGYAPQEITVGSNHQLAITLAEKKDQLNEVVVTALGIKRETKTLAYSATTVKTDQLTIDRSTNLGDNLEGKIAGVNISPPASGPGGSTKIRLRGQSTLGGDNSPLIVLNGVPISNQSISAGGSAGNGTGNVTGGSSDQGDGLQSINQDDIESMTVLKGATAAALYGASASNGAIIITTKSGSKSGTSIEYNLSTSAEQALDYTNFQYVYGEGENGVRPATQADAQTVGVHSFGVPFDNQPYIQFDGSTRSYSPFKNRISAFYNTGSDVTQSLAVSSGNDKGGFRLSYAKTDAKSIMPNSDFHKSIFNLGVNYKLTEKLSTQVNINYSTEFNHNPPQIGIQDMDANTTIYTMANSIDPNWLKNYQDASGNELSISRFTNRNNPYWVTLKRFENVHRDRLLANLSLKYQILPWLYIQGRVAEDYFTRPYNYDRPTGTRSIGAVTTGFNGYYYQDVTTYRQRNSDFLIGGNHKFGNFGVDVTLGGNQQDTYGDNISTAVNNFYVRDLYTIGNGQIKTPAYNSYEFKTNSLYAAGEFSYKSYLYLNVTGRNDWYSVLNPATNSYLYPSVGLSFIFSDALGKSLPSWLDYGKLRATYAAVGSGGVGAYSNNLYYNLNANQFNGVGLGGYTSTTAPNANLKPQALKETELGLDLRMFKSRVNLDLAVYNKVTTNEILAVGISQTSGFNATYVNIGKQSNKGIEALLTLVPVRNNNFQWETIFNAAYNKTLIIQLANGQTTLDVGTGEFFGTVSDQVGYPAASLRGFDYKRDAQGRILLAGGMPQQGNLVTFGSAIPTWTGGWNNHFTFKGIDLGIQIDFKAGNKIMSNSNLNFTREGLSQSSLVGRVGGVVFPGVNADGSTNVTAVPAEQFYTTYRSTSIATPFVYNGSFVKLRSITAGYDFTKFVNTRYVKGVRLALYVHNVLIIKKYIDNLDPEASVSSSDNLQGIETHTLPTTRTFGLNLNLKF
ncbi:MAG: SusC/RagA family TonB-linked outer membrane protein [Mucilaginibacter sp.]